jgi:hypothetical protein
MWRYGNWEVAEVKGAYYAPQMRMIRQEGRICKVPYDPLIPVDTYWDIGVGDSTAIGLVQHVGLEYRFVDYYQNEGEGLSHYLNWLRERQDKFKFPWGKHYGPHDLEVREWGNDAETRVQSARKAGFVFVVLDKAKFEDGIQNVRDILPYCVFDELRCEVLVDALVTYRKKYNQRLGEFTNEPEHDWASHPADMVRYFAQKNKPTHSISKTLSKRKQNENADSFDKYKLFR